MALPLDSLFRKWSILMVASVLLLTGPGAPVITDAAPPPLTESAEGVAVTEAQLNQALARAGDNRSQLQTALENAPSEQSKAVRFLIAYMPERDLKSLSAEFILKNVKFAYQARQRLPWGKDIPEAVFFNDVLPYASINERRDDWRQDFMERFLPLMEKEEVRTPGEAAQILNRDMFKMINVSYHARKRPKPDQSPYESMEAQYASCSGLSVLLIDACRAMAVPARFAGTPLWANKRGNHSWVEVWDDGEWHFTGACEYNAKGLNKTWFQGAASKAIKEDRRHAIYASSWKRTGTTFPLVWDRSIDYVAAVNVTDRYTGKSRAKALGANEIKVGIQAWEKPGGERVVTAVTILQDREVVQKGKTRGPGDDANNYYEVSLKKNTDYLLKVAGHSKSEGIAFRTESRDSQTLNVYLNGDTRIASRKASASGKAGAALTQLRAYLDQDRKDRGAIADQPFAATALNRDAAQAAARFLWQDHLALVKATRQQEMSEKVLKQGKHVMPFDFTIYGEKPTAGRSLYISMHGGGGAPKRVNDRQWQNQKKLYQPKEGVYVAPRAPTDTWNLWHQGHIDPLFDRLIENMVVFHEVDPNRVYIMGYSAGGDGVYQLAPRMADRLAAAAMMAGHPNETSPLGLRNIGFTLHMGGKDAAYKRNQTARTWKTKLAELRKEDPEGYRHEVVIHEDMGHWMQKKDAVALPWMAAITRDPFPKKIVWKQDDVRHTRFYWVAMRPEDAGDRRLLRAERNGQTLRIESPGLTRVTLLLNDHIVDLSKPVIIELNGKKCFEGIAPRTVAAIHTSLQERGDPRSIYTSRITTDY